MVFIGILTDKNSENNIKNIMKNKIGEKKFIFLNKTNIENFRNVKFDSVIINEKIENRKALNKILEKTKYIICNSDIYCKSNELKKKINPNIITYGYNSNATVTISSVTDENFLICLQENIEANNKIEGIQEFMFEKNNNNINAYDGMIMTIMNLIYKKNT